MKKITIMLMLVLAFVFVGCTTSQVASTPTQVIETQESSPTPVETTQEVNTQLVETNQESSTEEKAVLEEEIVDQTTSSLSFDNSYREFNQQEFELAKEAGYYVVLDFYSTWCPKCNTEDQILSSSFTNLENIVVFKVNHGDPETTDDEETLAETYDISNRASGVILKGETEFSRYSGHKSESEYRELFDSLI